MVGMLVLIAECLDEVGLRWRRRRRNKCSFCFSSFVRVSVGVVVEGVMRGDIWIGDCLVDCIGDIWIGDCLVACIVAVE